MSQVQRNLGAPNTEKLRAYVLQRESGGSGGYGNTGNQFGFIGGYQFGAAALEDVGFLRPGTSKRGNSALDNPSNWTIPGGKQAFLSNPAMQDRAFLNYADRNYNTLSRAGVIKSNTPPEQVAGYIAASHLVGAGGVISDRTLNRVDGNGVAARSYYQGAAGAISGRTEVPPLAQGPSSGTGQSPGQNTPPSAPFTGSGTELQTTPIREEILVSTFSSSQRFIELPQTNQLSQFSSYSVIFTLSSINAQQLNFPENSYKQGFLGKVVAKGGGAGDNLPTTASGRHEFFLDDFEFDMLMTFNRQTKGTNATIFTFSITEPYSMGLFFQAMSVVAVENGHTTYLESPFLLTMEFIGYPEDGAPIKLHDEVRHLPIRITNIQMNVSNGGSKYRVNALAWNEQAYFDEFNKFKTDVGISGATVLELLQTGDQSLQSVMNKRIQEITARESAAKAPDEVAIIFPKQLLDREVADDGAEEFDGSATLDPAANPQTNLVDSRLTLTRGQGNIRSQESTTVNEIGVSSMDFDMTRAGDSAMINDSDAQSDPDKGVNRSRVKFDPNSRLYVFEQGTSIVNAISSVVTMSKYCKDAVDPARPKVDEKGMVPWFRIESEVYIQPSKTGNQSSGRTPLLLVYKVVPYMVHSSKLIANNTQNKGLNRLETEVAKVYDYLYTGKNTEVLKFDLEFKTAVFTPSTADQGKTSAMAAYARQFAVADSSSSPTTANLVPFAAGDPLAGSSRQGQYLEQNPDLGGSIAVDYRTLIAQNFNKALYDGQVDLINAEMDIMGDPYFIADSGIGNFSNTGTGSFNMTNNYSMDYQSGEVHIRINFRTPLDYGEDGIMNFGPSEVVEAFSGLYRVNSITNRVNRGKFTQTLRILRVPNQNPVLTQWGTFEGSEQTELLREQERGFDDTDESNPPGAKVDPAIQNILKGRVISSASQVSSVTPGIVDATPEQTFPIFWGA